MMTKFDRLSKKLGAQGADNPDALAAYIGRRKHGAKKFQKMAEKGRLEHQIQAIKRAK